MTSTTRVQAPHSTELVANVIYPVALAASHCTLVLNAHFIATSYCPS